MENKKCHWTPRNEIREPSMEAQGISRGLEIKERDFKSRAENGIKDILLLIGLKWDFSKCQRRIWEK